MKSCSWRRRCFITANRLKNPHPNLLPEGEGIALPHNAKHQPRFPFSPAGETHAQAAVRAVFNSFLRSSRANVEGSPRVILKVPRDPSTDARDDVILR
jgi:hypothetical protein